jgi:hypothetical protein
MRTCTGTLPQRKCFVSKTFATRPVTRQSFFDIHGSSKGAIRDDEGLTFPGMADACHEA